MVMAVEVQDVLKGDAVSPGGRVYVLCDKFKPLREHSAALPEGTHVGLYLASAPTERGSFIVGNEGAGRPSGEPLWLAGPQAFIVADGETEGVVFPMYERIAPAAEFEDQLPGGDLPVSDSR